jgi:hypothetical protein
MKKVFYNLPKGYLSHAQMSLWLSSPKRYKEYYFLGNKFDLTGAAVEFGGEVANALESGEETGDELTDSVIYLLPKYSERDQPLMGEWKMGKRWVKLFAKPDTYEPTTQDFREYKTGRGVWTQGKVDKDQQILFYATTIYLKTGRVPPNVHLDWARTKYNLGTGKVEFTGEITTFKRVFQRQELLAFAVKIGRVVKEIELEWVKFNSKST